MNVEFINPFVTASYAVLKNVLAEEPTKGQISAQPSCFTSDQVNVVIGATGDAVGVVILGMSLTTADRIATKMVGSQIVSFDALAASAIAELGNMISGNALQALFAAGYTCDIAPPTVFRGTGVQITTVNQPSILIPLTLSQGNICLTVSLSQVSDKRTA